jgi:hypothetical protein
MSASAYRLLLHNFPGQEGRICPPRTFIMEQSSTR